MQKYFILTASLSFLMIGTTSHASAAWGCFAKNKPGGWGNSWNAQSKDQAAEIALKNCSGAGNQGCFIVGCRSDMDTEAEVRMQWPPPSEVKVRCGQGTDTSCQ